MGITMEMNPSADPMNPDHNDQAESAAQEALKAEAEQHLAKLLEMAHGIFQYKLSQYQESHVTPEQKLALIEKFRGNIPVFEEVQAILERTKRDPAFLMQLEQDEIRGFERASIDYASELYRHVQALAQLQPDRARNLTTHYIDDIIRSHSAITVNRSSHKDWDNTAYKENGEQKDLPPAIDIFSHRTVPQPMGIAQAKQQRGIATL